MDEQSKSGTCRFLLVWQIVGDRKRGIEPIVPVGKSSWWAGVKKGIYPQPVKLGYRITAWRAEDVYRLGSGDQNDSDSSKETA